MSAEPATELSAIDAAGPIEFLLIYAVIGAIGVIVAKGAQHVLLELLDPREPNEPPPRKGSFHERLTIGYFPRPDEILALAHLKDGVRGVAGAIVARAISEGWLVGCAGGRFDVIEGPAARSEVTRELMARLPHGSATLAEVNREAAAVAETRSEKLDEELLERELLRPTTRIVAATVVYLVFAVAVLGFGLTRLVRHGGSVAETAPVMFLVVAFAGAFVAFGRPARATTHGQRLLKWILDATESLRAEVRSKEARSDDDVALAAAIEGVAIVPGYAMAARTEDDDGATVPSGA